MVMTALTPPYAAYTRAQGWRLDLDYQAIEEQDTWALLDGAGRAWYLKLLFIAWKQVPAGTLPDDRHLIAARLEISMEEFAKLADLLLRDWTRHEDGRLYHPLLTEGVLRMLKKREDDKGRQTQFRFRKSVARPREDSKGKELEDWMATLPKEWSQALRDEFDGAREAGHKVVFPFRWAQGVVQEWSSAGKIIPRFGDNRARWMEEDGVSQNTEERRAYITAGVQASLDEAIRRVSSDV